MSALHPAIEEWERKGLSWKYIFSPKIAPFKVPPNGKVSVSPATYKYPEGVLIFFSAGFDSPHCGVAARWDPNFESGDVFVIKNMALLPRSDPLVFTLVPPYTPPGFYAVRVASPWKWTDSLDLYVINTDTVPHTCIAFAYMLAVLERGEVRPLELEKAQGGA